MYYPLIILFSLALLYYALPVQRYDPESYSPEKFPLSYTLFQRVLYISPNTTQTQEIASYLNQTNNLSIKKIVFCKDRNDMQRAFLAEKQTQEFFEENYGVEFSNQNFTQYTILTDWDDNLFDKYKYRIFVNGNACRKNSKISYLSNYDTCAGNKFHYRGFTTFQYNLDKIIREVILR